MLSFFILITVTYIYDNTEYGFCLYLRYRIYTLAFGKLGYTTIDGAQVASVTLDIKLSKLIYKTLLRRAYCYTGRCHPSTVMEAVTLRLMTGEEGEGQKCTAGVGAEDGEGTGRRGGWRIPAGH